MKKEIGTIVMFTILPWDQYDPMGSCLYQQVIGYYLVGIIYIKRSTTSPAQSCQAGQAHMPRSVCRILKIVPVRSY